jgi:two-component system chemotaxis response regulator CheY
MKKCLIVDDSSVIRKIARRILEEMDFQIVEAENGARAMEICERKLPDAILLGWNMPVMDGHEFLGNLRRMPGGDQPKVVFCATENGIDHIARALHAGANEYIMKPFDKDICRNVLIYFDQDTKADIFNRLARASEPDGFLVLGAAETVVGLTDVFKPHPERRGLYRPSGTRAAPARMPPAAAVAPRVAAMAGH